MSVETLRPDAGHVAVFREILAEASGHGRYVDVALKEGYSFLGSRDEAWAWLYSLAKAVERYLGRVYEIPASVVVVPDFFLEHNRLLVFGHIPVDTDAVGDDRITVLLGEVEGWGVGLEKFVCVLDGFADKYMKIAGLLAGHG